MRVGCVGGQGEELRFQLKTTDEMQEAKSATEEENKRLRREVALYHEKETQCVRNVPRRRDGRRCACALTPVSRSVRACVRAHLRYARGGHRKTREIRELTAQVQTLEKSLSQVVRDFEREREAIEAKHKEQVRVVAVTMFSCSLPPPLPARTHPHTHATVAPPHPDAHPAPLPRAAE